MHTSSVRVPVLALPIFSSSKILKEKKSWVLYKWFTWLVMVKNVSSISFVEWWCYGYLFIRNGSSLEIAMHSAEKGPWVATQASLNWLWHGCPMPLFCTLQQLDFWHKNNAELVHSKLLLGMRAQNYMVYRKYDLNTYYSRHRCRR